MDTAGEAACTTKAAPKNTSCSATPLSSNVPHLSCFTVVTQTCPTTPILTRITRCLFGLAGVILLALLATAIWLEPDPRGMGTHQKLGLPPCSFKEMFGRPCPSCGMTTSWSYLVRGQFLKSFDANLGGTLLALSAAIVAPWLLISAWRGRPATCPPPDLYVALAALTISAVTLLQWGMRIAAE